MFDLFATLRHFFVTFANSVYNPFDQLAESVLNKHIDQPETACNDIAFDLSINAHDTLRSGVKFPIMCSFLKVFERYDDIDVFTVFAKDFHNKLLLLDHSNYRSTE